MTATPREDLAAGGEATGPASAPLKKALTGGECTEAKQPPVAYPGEAGNPTKRQRMEKNGVKRVTGGGERESACAPALDGSIGR